MSQSHRWRAATTALLTGWALLACGGGDGASPDSAAALAQGTALQQEAGAPVLLNNVAVDGLNWINYRRAQAGMPVVARNPVIDAAAQGHSEYQKTNNSVTHDQTVGKPGFTGAALRDRLTGAGYTFAGAHAFGEVISAATSNSGFFLAEELITAIYHRFVIFEPKFKEIGTGSATTAQGFTYFTSDFTANNGHGPGIGRGNLATWPANGQTNVTPNFFSDFEAPDPVANANEVGYPVSVHADIDVVLTVQEFAMRPRGGADLAVKELSVSQDIRSASTDIHRPDSAAAIIPLSVLKANTTYDVRFSGTTDGVAITKTWSFTTR